MGVSGVQRFGNTLSAGPAPVRSTRFSNRRQDRVVIRPERNEFVNYAGDIGWGMNGRLVPESNVLNVTIRHPWFVDTTWKHVDDSQFNFTNEDIAWILNTCNRENPPPSVAPDGDGLGFWTGRA